MQVWYSEIFLNTAATEMISVGVGNGTRATRTSLIQDAGDFTFNPSAPESAVAPLTQVNFEPTLNVGGALLTSPTAYNVFTAYSVTSEYESNNICITSSGSKVLLSSAYSQTLPSASGRVFLDPQGQQQFIDFLDFTSCSGGGENFAATALIQVTNTTATMTTTFSGILAAASAGLTIAPVGAFFSKRSSFLHHFWLTISFLKQSSSPRSVSAGVTTSAPFPSVAVPQIVFGNSTITPTANPIGLPVYNDTTFAAATSFITPTGSLTLAGSPSPIAFLTPIGSPIPTGSPTPTGYLLPSEGNGNVSNNSIVPFVSEGTDSGGMSSRSSGTIISRPLQQPTTVNHPPPSTRRQLTTTHHRAAAQPVLPTATPASITIDEYHALSDEYIDTLVAQFEELQEEREDVDVEYSAGVLTLKLPPKGTYLLNKQPPNKQIWLSSPVSGPKRYDWVTNSNGDSAGGEGEKGDWVYLRDGSTLNGLLEQEVGVRISNESN
ncbi:MAG: hypothetical protein Q9217_003499 [Psora testacea]